MLSTIMDFKILILILPALFTLGQKIVYEKFL